MRITFKQIEVFVAIAKVGNMTQAANEVSLTQSACSMALSVLEKQLNGLLFDRHGKRLILNERGRVLFPKAVTIITQMQELQDLMIGNKENSLSGHLVIGASTTIGNYKLPKIIGAFVTHYPQTKITLQIANTEQIIQKILNFEVDMAMIEGNCFSNEIDVFPWKKDELIIIAAADHPLAKKRKISLQDLHNAKWILREPGSGTRVKFDEAMNGKITAFLELGHTEAIKQAVYAGLGVSCLSKTAVADVLHTGQVVELKSPFLKLTRDFYILIHKQKYQTKVLTMFRHACEKSK